MVALLPSGRVIVPPVAAEMNCETDAMVPAIITALDADFDESARLVAAIVTVKGVGTVAGAVYKPVPSIVPTVPFPFGIPFTSQFIELSGLPALLMVAVNCRVELVGTVCVPTGEVTTVTVMSLVTVIEASACFELSA
jgi:hypothetical protein